MGVGLPALFVVGAAAALVAYSFASVPLPEDLGLAPTVVYDVHGTEIGELQQEATRDDVALDDLSDHVVDAVLAAEDAGFRSHRGVSVAGILRAAYTNLVRREVRQGGSTISQQYVKNFTGEADDTLLRKVNEAALAVKLERQFSKDQILELYLNSIYFGRGAYGIQAAARAYYDVDASELSAEQAALLAGLLPAPSALDPAQNADGAERRYRYVVERLLGEGWVTAAEADAMRARQPDVVPARPVVARQAPFFMAMVERELAEALGEEQVHRGLEVRTALDLPAQLAAERVYAAAFAALDVPEGGTRPTGALVALDPGTGGIRALVGGPDYAEDQFNLATGGSERAGRGPGSTFKPFALAAWIERGWSPESLVDSPAELVLPAEELDIAEDWRLANYGGTEHGTLTLRDATVRSSNTAFAQVALEVGADAVLDLARRAGVDPAGRLRPDPSLVLGTGEVTPVELAEGYSTFAAGGTHHDAVAVLEASRDGRTLHRADTEGQRAFSEQVAHAVTDVLRGVIDRGTGTAAQIGRPAAGKTGTTQNHGDAWFAGYTPDLAAVVWIGNRDDRNPVAGEPTGGGFPAELWRDFMREALDGVEPSAFPAPPGDLVMHDLEGGSVTEAQPAACTEGEVLVPADAGDPAGEMVCVAGAADDPAPGTTAEARSSPSPGSEPAAEPAAEPTAEPAPEPAPAPAPSPEPAPAPGQPEPQPPPPAPESQPESGQDADSAEAG